MVTLAPKERDFRGCGPVLIGGLGWDKRGSAREKDCVVIADGPCLANRETKRACHARIVAIGVRAILGGWQNQSQGTSVSLPRL